MSQVKNGLSGPSAPMLCQRWTIRRPVEGHHVVLATTKPFSLWIVASTWRENSVSERNPAAKGSATTDLGALAIPVQSEYRAIHHWVSRRRSATFTPPFLIVLLAAGSNGEGRRDFGANRCRQQRRPYTGCGSQVTHHGVNQIGTAKTDWQRASSARATPSREHTRCAWDSCQSREWTMGYEL